MSEKVVAITIGPIYDTMQLVTKPAGLWGASYLFSYISCRLTEKVCEAYPDSIITPYFEFDKSAETLRKNGVGYYHDHILLRGGDMEKVNDIIVAVKKEIAELISDGLKADDGKKDDISSYVSSYLQIYAVEVVPNDNENAIQATSKYLDGMELQKQFIPAETENYIASFLDNDVIRDSGIVPDNESWMLKVKGRKRLKDLLSIAKSDSRLDNEYKRYEYYVLVNSDGDRMGKLIEKADDDEAIRKFSLNCMSYTTEACKRIIKFGGVVVYAGGDDLQFLAPLTHGEDTIFDLLAGITADFQDVFVQGEEVNNDERPSVSFGVEIVYYKFPLYEALSASYDLLHQAKESGRDAAIIRLQKHSGQTSEIMFKNISGDLADLNKKMKPILEEQYSDDTDPLKSVISHLSECKALCEEALKSDKNEALQNFIVNTFDNPGQEKWSEYLDSIHDLMKMHEGYQAAAVSDDSYIETDAFISLMRILQFFGEKGKEDYIDEDDKNTTDAP